MCIRDRVRSVASRRRQRERQEEVEELEREAEQRKHDEEAFFRVVERMFEDIRKSASERLDAARKAAADAFAELEQAKHSIAQREQEIARLKDEVGTEKQLIQSLEQQVSTLNEHIAALQAEMADDVFVQEMLRRLNEAYGVLGALEEAYLASPGPG